MTKRTTAELTTDILALLADGGQTGLGIPAADHRQIENNLVDSFPNKMDLTASADDDGNVLILDVTGRDVIKAALPSVAGRGLTVVTGSATLSGKAGRVRVDCTSGDITLTLPASPSDGMMFQIKRADDQSGNDLTLDGNGKTIEGDSTVPLYSGEALTLVFNTTADTWDVY
jgi:hypothetical protein